MSDQNEVNNNEITVVKFKKDDANGLYYRPRYQEWSTLSELADLHEVGRPFKISDSKGLDITEDVLKKVRRLVTKRLRADSESLVSPADSANPVNLVNLAKKAP